VRGRRADHVAALLQPASLAPLETSWRVAVVLMVVGVNIVGRWRSAVASEREEILAASVYKYRPVGELCCHSVSSSRAFNTATKHTLTARRLRVGPISFD